MDYSVKIDGFEGQVIEVRSPTFFAGYRLLVNGQPAPKGKRNQMVLRRNDGKEVIATWKSQVLGFDVPQLVVDGTAIPLVEPLRWYEWVWSGLPILLVLTGGEPWMRSREFVETFAQIGGNRGSAWVLTAGVGGEGQVDPKRPRVPTREASSAGH